MRTDKEMAIFATKKKQPIRRNPAIMTVTPREPVAIYVPKWLINSLIVLGVVGGLVYFLFISPFFSIRQVMIEGPLSDDGKQLVDKYRGANIWRLRSAQIEQEILQVYPQLQSIKVYRGLPDTIKVVVEERPVALLWVAGDKIYLVDERGVVFREAKNNALATFAAVPRITDVHGVAVTIGQRVATLRLLGFIQAFGGDFKNKTGIGLVGWEVGETSIHATAVAEKGWRVLTDTTQTPDDQLNNLVVIINKHVNDIHEYIDLRVPGYAYYK